MLVVIIHPVVHKASQAIEMHERVSLNLLGHRRTGFLGIIVSRQNHRAAGQVTLQAFKGMKHLLRVAAAQIATPATEYKQGVTGNQPVTNPVTG